MGMLGFRPALPGGATLRLEGTHDVIHLPRLENFPAITLRNVPLQICSEQSGGGWDYPNILSHIYFSPSASGSSSTAFVSIKGEDPLDLWHRESHFFTRLKQRVQDWALVLARCWLA